MHPYGINEKARDDDSGFGGCAVPPPTNQDIGMAPDSYRRPSLREEAEKSVGYHREQADKHDRAVAFFRENPAFDEFIQLIRSGAIQI